MKHTKYTSLELASMTVLAVAVIAAVAMMTLCSDRHNRDYAPVVESTDSLDIACDTVVLQPLKKDAGRKSHRRRISKDALKKESVDIEKIRRPLQRDYVNEPAND